jgi:hypothetical protein
MMKYKRILLQGLIFTFFVLSIVGCGVFQVGIDEAGRTEPTRMGVETQVSTSIPSSPTSEPIILTTPSVTAPVEEGPAPSSQAYCLTGIAVEGVEQLMPSLMSLDWEIVNHDLGPIRQLNGIPTLIWGVDMSPDGRWWAVEMLKENFGAGSADVRLLFLSAFGDRHWFSSGSGDAMYRRYAWLEDDRLLWINGGNLYLTNNDGSNREDLYTLGALEEVWLGADHIALAYGDGVLWRVDLDSGQWEEVEDVPSFGNLSLALDGKTAAFVRPKDPNFNEVEYWFVPLTMGEPAEIALEGEARAGHGGRAHPPYQVPNEPYWKPVYLVDPMLINQVDGSAVPIDEVAHYFEALGKHAFPSYSPDGEWIYFLVEQNPYTFYIAPANDPDNGRLYEDVDILGWSSDPAGVLVLSFYEDSILLLPLPSGEPKVLLRGLASSIIEVGNTEEFFFLLPDLEDRVHEDPYEIYVFSKSGELRGTLELPRTSGVPNLVGYNPSNLLIQMTLVGDFENSICKYKDVLWYWEIIR